MINIYPGRFPVTGVWTKLWQCPTSMLRWPPKYMNVSSVHKLLNIRVVISIFQAYNLLHPPCRTRYVETIMINIGTEHLLAEAVIALALYKNQTVFVTVRNDNEAISLLNKFPKVNLLFLSHFRLKLSVSFIHPFSCHHIKSYALRRTKPKLERNWKGRE